MAAEDYRKPWSQDEIEATVENYFHMLALELSGQEYSKARHRRALLLRLNNRTEAAIERKHQNISAILQELNAPWIIGYKPLSNYQQALYDAVVARLAKDDAFDRAAIDAVERPAVAPSVPDFRGLLAEAPAIRVVEETPTERYGPMRTPVRRDYLAVEARNRSLGQAGEEFVVAYERFRLHSLGAKRLADRVEHVSQTRGDGLGYDVLSFDVNGAERFIEVKTTAFGREAPFYVSRNELQLSKEAPGQFRLYRLFEFRKRPRMFELRGPLNERCRLDAVTYLASFT